MKTKAALVLSIHLSTWYLIPHFSRIKYTKEELEKHGDENILAKSKFFANILFLSFYLTITKNK